MTENRVRTAATNNDAASHIYITLQFIKHFLDYHLSSFLQQPFEVNIIISISYTWQNSYKLEDYNCKK